MGKKIVGVAIKASTGIVYSLPAPNRHGGVIVKMVQEGCQKPVTKDATQGFILADGEFVDRLEGLEIAKENGQYKPKYVRNQLFSEDLW